MNKIQQVGEIQKFFTIDFRLTTKCNYSCYYCEDLHDNTNSNYTFNLNNLGKLIQTIKDKYEKKVVLYLFGGEPTLHKDLSNIILSVKDHFEVDDHEILIQSNLSLKPNSLNKLITKLKDVKNLKFNISYHNTQTNFMPFYKNCLLLKNNNRLGLITCMYNKEKCVLQDFKKLKTTFNDVDISPLICSRLDGNVELDVNKTNEELKYFKNAVNDPNNFGYFFDKGITVKYDNTNKNKSLYDFWIKKENSFTGYDCFINQDKIYIEHDGGVYKCFYDVFSKIKPIFNLNDNIEYDTVLNKDCIICPHKYCHFEVENLKINKDRNNITPEKLSKFYSTSTYRKMVNNERNVR